MSVSVAQTCTPLLIRIPDYTTPRLDAGGHLSASSMVPMAAAEWLDDIKACLKVKYK